MTQNKRILVNPIKQKCFNVYLLYTNNEIVYVGKTTRPVEIRVQHHLIHSEKIFDSYEIIKCNSEQEMNELEAKLIFKNIPKYNKQLPILPSQNIVYVGQIKEYQKVDKLLGIDGIILKGKVYIKIK